MVMDFTVFQLQQQPCSSPFPSSYPLPKKCLVFNWDSWSQPVTDFHLFLVFSAQRTEQLNTAINLISGSQEKKLKSSIIMLMNWITHKPGQQPAWETGEISHLISSALTEIPEKGGPSEAASPSPPSIWTRIPQSQLKPSSCPNAQQKDRTQI